MNTEKKVNEARTEFKARVVKLAVESNQPFSKTTEEEVNKNTLYAWRGKYHRAQAVKRKMGENTFK